MWPSCSILRAQKCAEPHEIDYKEGYAELLNVFLSIDIPEYDLPIIFGAPVIRFTRTGGFIDAKLGLIADIPVPIFGSDKTLMVMKGYNPRTAAGSYATITCDGFESIDLVG